jgi:hypothetical protein
VRVFVGSRECGGDYLSPLCLRRPNGVGASFGF